MAALCSRALPLTLMLTLLVIVLLAGTAQSALDSKERPAAAAVATPVGSTSVEDPGVKRVRSDPESSTFSLEPISLTLEQPLSPSGPGTEKGTAAPSDLVLGEDFETFDIRAQWRVFDQDGPTNGEYYWERDDYRPYQGTFAAWPARGGANGVDPQFSPYQNNMRSWMIHGPFSLEGAEAAYMRFLHWTRTEYGYDYIFWGVRLMARDSMG